MDDDWTDEQRDAIDEFRRCATDFVERPCAGTRYALAMAGEACLLVGVDPSRITPTGYERPLDPPTPEA